MKLKITVEGKAYEVDVEVADPESSTGIRYVATGVSGATAPIAAPVGTNGAIEQVADETKVCRSPLAGVVSELNAAVGDEVKTEQQLLVLEAMKMFTSITSSVVGKVKSIRVGVGDAVKQGQVLVEFE